ncbi:MAG: hypothetical protein A2Z85_02200 [Chlamydiae bacterium GWA2_50_15]|nr:MAG: hypothetical protein A2Z85_02200 [Chlamydiae bacterium GWA2_50_15]
MIDIEALNYWFEKEKRDLPWRKERSFYRVWVSEVMLQQTQAAVVVPYFERWMKKFPSIEALASAAEEEVIKAWEGLGYYARARHLHAGAKFLLGKRADREVLLKIKGVGPYTLNSIRAFAFQERAAAVDGNVARVLSRLFLIDDPVDRIRTKKRFEELLLQLLPPSKPSLTLEAFIELGALVCQRIPLCFCCPLKQGCRGYASGLAASLPKKKQKTNYLFKERRVTVIFCGKRVLLRRNWPKQVMAGLYEFPYFEEGDLKGHFDKLGVQAVLTHTLSPVKQTFTRYRVLLFPSLFLARQPKESKEHEWKEYAALPFLPFSSGHRKILQALDAIKPFCSLVGFVHFLRPPFGRAAPWL